MAKLKKIKAPKKKGSQYASLREGTGDWRKKGFKHSKERGGAGRQKKRAGQNRIVMAGAVHGIRASKPKAFRGKKGKQAYRTLSRGVASGMSSAH